jgi:hypothetical protein
VAHLADRQRLARRVVARAAVAAAQGDRAGQVAKPVRHPILAGENQQDPGHGPRRGGIDPPDIGVRQGSAQHAAMRHAGQVDVVGITAVPGDQPLILEPPHRLTDTEFHRATLFSLGAGGGP